MFMNNTVQHITVQGLHRNIVTMGVEGAMQPMPVEPI